MILQMLNTVSGVDGWVKEHRFHPTRKWRADYANINYRVIVEIEGGIWVNGRHTSGAGYMKDMEKYNAAQLLGWKVFRYGTGKKELNRMCEEMAAYFNFPH